MNIRSEFKSLADPELRLGASICLLWRVCYLPILAASIPLFLVSYMGRRADAMVKVLGRPFRFVDSKIERQYSLAASARKRQSNTQ